MRTKKKRRFEQLALEQRDQTKQQRFKQALATTRAASVEADAAAADAALRAQSQESHKKFVNG